MTITQVSERFELSQDTLRYYERIGLIPRVTRTSGGIRAYEQEDLKWIQFAKCMKSAGLSLESIIEYVALFQQGDKTIAARKNILIHQRDLLSDKIEEMQETLDRLNLKIDNYEKKLMPRVQELLGGK